jgi:hypothetical protein
MAGNAWDSAVQKANQLASSWDVTPAAAVAEVTATPEAVPEHAAAPEKVEEVAAVAQEEQAKISEPAQAVEQAPVVDAVETTAAAETIIEENPAAGIPNVEEVAGAIENHYAHEPLVETAAAPHLSDSAVENIREEAAHVAAEAMPAEGSAAMDDLVAKVLARMSPEAMQAVTREILRPVVEALVRDELKSKK